MKNFKKHIPAIITTVLYAIISIFFVTGERLTNSTLYKVLVLIPALTFKFALLLLKLVQSLPLLVELNHS